MKLFETTNLWQSTLARRTDCDLDESMRERFRRSLIQFRNRAEDIAQSIQQDIRELTVHDVPRHIDALWQIANIVAGRDYRLSPAEAYVLGGAFLLHDLGLALASYPNGIDDLKRLPLWSDATARLFRQKHGRAPTELEKSNLDVNTHQAVLESVLRQNHAVAATTLALNEYRHTETSTAYYLIEDAELRNTYAELIGRIAYSHWWPIEQLGKEFNDVIGAFPGAPADWTIDPFKLACMLRVADASHIDARRAPGFSRALRKPSGLPGRHWRFQEYIQTPRVLNERLVFTVARPLPREDADAWWIGYELIQTADRELRDVDTLLREREKQPFAANGVAGANDPARLKRYVRTVDWEPVATEVGVSNVASLVTKLGGIQLYGNNPKVPLRELLQNARDAIAARRSAQDLSSTWGQINVRLVDNGDHEYVEVQDNGIGMSQRLLCGPFLDFGTSYWHTDLMMEEHPGLAASGFEPQGRYGIGFFSVFMWGEQVSIITRSIHEGPDRTKILEFGTGLSNRPLFRLARNGERLIEPGTIIRIWLTKKSHDRGGFLSRRYFVGNRANRREERKWTLAQLCEWLCPALDTTIVTDENGKVETAIQADGWKTLASHRLMYRLVLHACKDDTICEDELFQTISSNIRPIVDSNGECLGRAALTMDIMSSSRDENRPFPIRHTTVGLFRGWDHYWGHVAGFLIGRSTTAARTFSEPISWERLELMSQWATEQARLLVNIPFDPYVVSQLALAVRGFGGHTGDMLIGRDSLGFFTFRSLAARRDLPNLIELHDDQWALATRMRQTLSHDQLGVSTGIMRTLDTSQKANDPLKRAGHPKWRQYWPSLWAATIEAIAIAWDVPLVDVLEASEIHGGIEELPDAAFRLSPDIIRNPRFPP